MKLEKDSILNITIGVFLGMVIWACSPIIAGSVEPWDAKGAYYSIALFLSGIIGALIYHKKYLSTVLGIVIGQIIFILIFRFGPLWIIGIAWIVGTSFLTFLGAWTTKKFKEHVFD